MQAVDVLRDDARGFALRDEMSDCAMASIGLRLRDCFIDGDLSTPRFSSRFVRRHELAKVDWLVPGPDAARASEVRYAGFSADARAGEDYGVLAYGKHIFQLVDKRFLVGHVIEAKGQGAQPSGWLRRAAYMLINLVRSEYRL